MYLCHRQIDIKRRIIFETEMFDVANHSDYLDGTRTFVVIVDIDAGSNRALVGPKSAGHSFVDDNYRNIVRGVTALDRPALQQRYFHRVKTVRRRQAIMRVMRVARG